MILPWIMLLFKPVRQSRRLLFTAALLIVGGVMLNRFNVFVVSFKAPYATHPYYPAIGEILVTGRGRGHDLLPLPRVRNPLPGAFRPTTGGFPMRTTMLRVLATIAVAAVLGASAPALAAVTPAPAAKPVEKSRKNLNPRPEGWEAKHQTEAEKLARKQYPFVKDVLMEDLPLRQQRLRQMGIGYKDVKHSYILLDSPYVDTYDRQYNPVRFMHSKHAAVPGRRLRGLPPLSARRSQRTGNRGLPFLPPGLPPVREQ